MKLSVVFYVALVLATAGQVHSAPPLTEFREIPASVSAGGAHFEALWDLAQAGQFYNTLPRHMNIDQLFQDKWSRFLHEHGANIVERYYQ